MKKKAKKTSNKETPVEETKTETPAPVEESSAFSFDTLASVHDEIQEESPAPNDNAIAQQETTEAEKHAEHSGNTDSAGTVFDPAIHATNSEGEPSRTSLGKFRKKKGTSKLGATNKQIVEQQKSAEDKAAARAAGNLAADLLVGSAVTILGDEWQPVGDAKSEPVAFDEHSNLRRAFGDYFEAKGIHDFPPGIALTIAVSSYMMPRVVAGPETKSKLTRAKFWIAEKYENMKNRSRKNAAQSNSRNDGERKNDDSKKVVREESPTGERHAST